MSAAFKSPCDWTREQVVASSRCALCDGRVTFVGTARDGGHRAVSADREVLTCLMGNRKRVVPKGYPPLHFRCAIRVDQAPEARAAS